MSNARRRVWAPAFLRSAAAVVLVASMAACSGGSDDGGSDAPTTLTMASWSATTSMDPTQVAGTGNSGGAQLAALYDTIMTYNWETGEFEPNTAESLEPNDDFTEWTLTLREGITFTDGTPYDAAAVVANLERHVAAKSNASSLVTPISEYATPDERTVVFTLSAPWSLFPYALASTPGMVVSPAAVAKLGEDLGTNPEGAGAGPFMLEEFRAGESLKLVRNPDYWGGDVPLESVTFIHAGDGPTTLEAFQAGTVDVAFLRDAGAILDAEDAGLDSLQVSYSANNTMIMNNGLPIVCQGGQPALQCDGQADGTRVDSDTPTADPRVRQAVAAAIDLETLNQRVYAGAASMTSDLIGEGSRWYDGVDGPEYDIDQARALVEEVKADGWDGSIRVSCHSGQPTWGTAVSGMLEAAGFTVELNDQQDVAANTTGVIVRKDFDLACFGSSISDPEPFFAINRDFNSRFVQTGGGNFSGYVNPEVDAAIAAGRATSDPDEIRAAITTIARAYSEDVPFLALTNEPEVVLLDERLQGVEVSANTIVLLGKASFR